MRSIHRLLVLAIAVASIGPVAAPAAPKAVQVAEGSVVVMMRFPQDPTYTTWVKPQRDVWNNTKQNGYAGYVLPVDRKTWGGKFVIELLSGATGSEDLDVTFYSNLGEAPGSSASTTGDSTKRGVGGETGIVPSATSHAIVTLFTGANATFKYSGYAPVPQRKARVSKLPPPPKPGISATYGKSAPRALVDAFKKKSHVVIAFVDTGINPYHVAYRRPDRLVHPSLYINGFPKNAPALGLSIGEKDYVKARNRDDGPVWSKVAERKLYWIPGTNIVGAYSYKDSYDPTIPVLGDVPIPGVEHMGRPIIDDAASGHGTGVSSVAAGSIYGSNPNALIVVVEGFGTEAVKWAASQPWIDFISGSYGDPAAVPFNDATPRYGRLNTPSEEVNDFWGEVDSREYEHTGPFVLRDGRTACFSAGNGLSRTGLAYDRYSSIRPTSGPSWVVTVGAASPRNDNNYGWHSAPVDVSSYGNHWPAAHYASTDGTVDFSGTSSATPITCGVFSKVLLDARTALRDTAEGIHSVRGTRVPAAGRKGSGLLADGMLTRQELQDAVFKTAMPADFDPVSFSYEPIGTLPTTPGYYTQQGYGIVNKASGNRASDVVLGRSPMPDRSDVDMWIGAIDGIRDAIWSPDTYR